MDLLYELDREGLLNTRIKRTLHSITASKSKNEFCSDLGDKRQLIYDYYKACRQLYQKIDFALDNILKNLDLHTKEEIQVLINKNFEQLKRNSAINKKNGENSLSKAGNAKRKRKVAKKVMTLKNHNPSFKRKKKKPKISTPKKNTFKRPYAHIIYARNG